MVRFDEGLPKKMLAGQLTWFASWVIVTAAGLYLTPNAEGHGTHTQFGLPACPSVAFFDRPCFGCGMTTSFTATLHMDLAAAWQAHPFGTLFYVLFTISAFAALWGWTKGLRMNTDTKLFNRSAVVLTVVFVLFGIARFSTVKYDSVEHTFYKAAQELATSEEGR